MAKSSLLKSRAPMTRDEFFSMKNIASGGCWEWAGRKYPSGYGYNTKQHVDGHHEVRAHRLSYALTNGPIPAGMAVLHKCDNRACINPRHLFLGTQLDNMRDMSAKGRNRQPSGERHGMTALVKEDVLRIREAALFGANQYDLAKIYGIGQSTVSRIVRREAWASA